MQEIPEITAQTETVYLPSGMLTVEYSITAGDLLVSVLLTALIALFGCQWIYQVLFRRGG